MITFLRSRSFSQLVFIPYFSFSISFIFILRIFFYLFHDFTLTTFNLCTVLYIKGSSFAPFSLLSPSPFLSPRKMKNRTYIYLLYINLHLFIHSIKSYQASYLSIPILHIAALCLLNININETKHNEPHSLAHSLAHSYFFSFSFSFFLSFLLFLFWGKSQVQFDIFDIILRMSNI